MATLKAILAVASVAAIALVIGRGAWAQDAAGQASARPASDFRIKGAGMHRADGSVGLGPYTPDRACRLGVTRALVVMDCTAAPDGALSECSIVSETPADMGFGMATYVLAQRKLLSATPSPAADPPPGPRRVRLTIPVSTGSDCR